MVKSTVQKKRQWQQIAKYLALAGGASLLAVAIGPFFLIILDVLLKNTNLGGFRFSRFFVLNFTTFFSLPLGVMGLAAIRTGWQVATYPVRAGIFQLVCGLLATLFGFTNSLYWLPAGLLIVSGVLALLSIEEKAPAYLPYVPAYSGYEQPYQPARLLPIHPADLPTFHWAVGQAQSGDKMAAYLQFKTLERRNLDNIDLMLWVAFTAPTLLEAEGLIGRASAIAPGLPSVGQAQEWLAHQKASGRR